MRTNIRYCLTAAVASTCVTMIGVQPASSAESTPPDPLTRSGVVTLSGEQVDHALKDADRPGNPAEEHAVRGYLENGTSEGSYVTAQDLRVGSFEVAEGLEATLVVPEASVDVRDVHVWVDAGTNEIGAAAEVTMPESVPSTAGPGMGYWPKWVDTNSYVVELRLYNNGNYIGEAEFQTQRRKYRNDGRPGRDIWQVARRARATPDEIEVNNAPDVQAYVKKLWVSSNLTDNAHGHAQQWRQDLTKPDEGFSNCSGGVTVSAGPFSFTPGNCEDYDVWQGRIGHQRFDYDQGAYAGGNQRAIAYVSGFQMDNGKFPYMTWYEFVTLRLGHYSGQPELKCKSTERGYASSTQRLRCSW